MASPPAPNRLQTRPQARTVVTKDRIERAALSAFSQVGYDAASTRAIAKQAGVKQQLINEAYQLQMERIRKGIPD